MSDEHREPPGSDPAPEHHHGVVETLREEIHEAVEHVPQPVRWTLGKLVRVALLSLVALIVLAAVSAGLYLANRTQLVAHELTLVINQALAQRSDIVLEMDDLKGNPLTGFRAVRPSVRFRDGAPLLDASEIRVRYSALGLLRRDRRPIVITLESPDVRLDTGPGGTLRLPAWRTPSGPGRRGGGGRPLAFELHLRDATLHGPQPMGRVEGLEMDLSGSTGGATRVALQRLAYRRGPWGSRLDRLAADFSSDPDSVRFRIRELSASDFALTAVGGWRSGSAVRRLHADVSRVRWSWLAKVFDNGSFDVPGEGNASVDAVYGQRWTGRFVAALDWDSLDVAGRGLFSWDGHELALDSLAGRSAAGNLLGRLRWSKQGWEIGGHAENADPSNWSAIHLEGWPAGRINGTFRYAVDTHGKASSRLEARILASQWTGWDVDSATVRVEFPAQARDSFSVVGWRSGGRFTLHAIVAPSGWGGPYTIEHFPLEAWPDGRASGLAGVLAQGQGTVQSHAGVLDLTGDLAGAATTWSSARFAGWTLAGIQGRLLPKPDLVARARMADGFFVGVHFDSAEAEVQLGDQNVGFGPATIHAGDTLMTLAGDAAWDRDGWRTTMTSTTAKSSQFDWVAEPPLRISGDVRGTVFDRVVADDHDAHLEARGRWASPEGFYDFVMQGNGLDLSALGLPQDWGLAGRGDARLAVTGRAGDPAWTFDGRVSRPGFGGHRCDSLSLSLEGSQHRLRVGDLVYRLNGGEVRASGGVERALKAWPDSLTATAVVRWLQDAGAWNGSLQAKSLPVDRLSAYAPAAEGWGGTVSGALSFSGSPQHPEATLTADARDIGWRDYRAQRVEASARYASGVLALAEGRITMQDVVSTVTGKLPVQLALGHDPVVPDAPLEGRAQVPRGDLKLLPALVPLIQTARGGFDLDAAIAGTTRHPRLQGVAHIRDGVVRPEGRDEILEGVYADLHFDEQKITLDSLSAKQGRTGRVRSKGVVNLNGLAARDYRFDLSMRDFASTQEGLYAALFDGDFVVVDGPLVHGERVPQVSGDVHVKRGVVEFDFANQSEVQKRAEATEPLYWTYHIHLDAPGNLHWRPEDGDIEFNADLDLEQTPDSLLIYGEMHEIKGHYFFLSNRFNITNADLTFDNQRGVDPVMDISAETKLRASRSELAAGDSLGNQLEAIEVHITGRSSQPVIDLTSASGWDQRQILGELTYGRFTGEGVSPTDPVQNYLTRQINNQLSRDLSGWFNNRVDQWEIQRSQGELLGSSATGSVYVNVGGSAARNLSWTYSQRVPGLDRPGQLAPGADTFERDVAVEYRINRFIFVTTELTQRRVLPVGASQSTPGVGNGAADFNVNLKARWEY